jgi:hypothetical protein
MQPGAADKPQIQHDNLVFEIERFPIDSFCGKGWQHCPFYQVSFKPNLNDAVSPNGTRKRIFPLRIGKAVVAKFVIRPVLRLLILTSLDTLRPDP